MSKKILFIHQNFPGQFPHIADALVARGDKVVAIGSASAKPRPGVTLVQWRLPRGTTTGIFDPATRAEADLLRADAAARKAWELKAKGFVPDLIIGHPGWGETIHLSEVFPGVPQIAFGEFFYKSSGGDVGFDKEFEKNEPVSDMRVHAKNLGMALAYSEADVIVCPTAFQASTLPKGLQHRIRVFHEGVDISNASRKPDATFKLPDGRVLDRSKPVITFINRNFERLRGFHIFMRALPAFLEACPEAEVLLIGRDGGKGYGAALPGGKTWKGVMLDEVGDRLDMGRVHFTGPVTHSDMIAAMSISWAHVYYTYPFVLSWSLVEAMACECLILGSDTAPVRDAITPGENGVLNDFFDVDALSDAMVRACREPEAFAALRPKARETALKMFDHKAVGVPAWMDLIDEVLATR
ncbi:glycosyltransferase [Caulobacter segnis]|uniref:glycosyltransferase n=1 Tax=Caulobacter segnis TaxID=88688 RepID=UPI002862D3D1|nr:glycosyltransferase [Caulobacter segnis]MDR6627995.1 glycosyltransferase involved in cell wall biosynthesis [Caulobacter segnis]